MLVAILRVVAIKCYDQTMYDLHTMSIIKYTGSKHEEKNNLNIELIN